MTPLEMGVIEFYTIRAFVLWYGLQEENVTFKLESASSTVGAPCNEVSLCNRAGWLGMGYVEHTVARDGLLPQSGRVFRIRCVSPCRCIFAASPM